MLISAIRRPDADQIPEDSFYDTFYVEKLREGASGWKHTAINVKLATLGILEKTARVCSMSASYLQSYLPMAIVCILPEWMPGGAYLLSITLVRMVAASFFAFTVAVGAVLACSLAIGAVALCVDRMLSYYFRKTHDHSTMLIELADGYLREEDPNRIQQAREAIQSLNEYYGRFPSDELKEGLKGLCLMSARKYIQAGELRSALDWIPVESSQDARQALLRDIVRKCQEGRALLNPENQDGPTEQMIDLERIQQAAEYLIDHWTQELSNSRAGLAANDRLRVSFIRFYQEAQTSGYNQDTTLGESLRTEASITLRSRAFDQWVRQRSAS